MTTSDQPSVAIVTGAAQGIGWATARRLASRHHVILVGRTDDDRLRSRVQELTNAGLSAEGVASDVADADAVSALYQDIFKRFRRLDVLVANAGVLGDARIGMISEELLVSTLAINLMGTIRHLQGATRLMQRRGGGSIVLVSSIIGVEGNAGQVVYAASKAGVIGVMRSAAKELAPYGIRVNAVAPGYIDTQMIRHLPSDLHEARLAGIPMGRVGGSEEVADTIDYLASDNASYVTGQLIGVDGGMVI